MGWLTSDPQIYEVMNIKGQMAAIYQSDHVSRLKWLEKHGYKWSVEDEMMEIPMGKLPRYHHYDTPWCHARHLVGKQCSFDHYALFPGTGIIHPRCQSCWKTVISPKNFDECMTWKKVEEQEIPFACKVGIELRDYTSKHYGGYHYANSLDEGREQYETVVKLAKKYLSEETVSTILLKRACTEYEFLIPNSAAWTITDDQQDTLQLIEDRVNYKRISKPQAEFVKPFVMKRWLMWAHYIGDMSYLPYNNGELLWPTYQTFHDGPVQGIKHDIAVLNAHSNDVPMDVSDSFIQATDKFARDNGTTMDKLGKALGYNSKSPLGVMNLETLEVAEELIGEHGDAHGD